MDDFQLRRRGFIASAATIAAAPVTALSALPARAAAVGTAAAEDPTRSFGPIRQIGAGLLSVGYAELGPPEGMPVLLFHGWPYDIHSFIGVAPVLVQAGYRLIIPFARGSGRTRFLSPTTVRNGQPAALAQDAIDFMDALGIRKAIVAGFD